MMVPPTAASQSYPQAMQSVQSVSSPYAAPGSVL